MSDLNLLLRSWNALDDSTTAASPIPAQLAQGLADKQWRLLDIVKGLGEVLVDENDAVRSRGVGLLSAVVNTMDRSTLDRQSTQTLTTFFIGKLADGTSMLPCISALTALTESPMFGVGEGMQVARGIFASVKLQSHPQAARFTVYTLLDSLMSRSRPALKRLGREFISGYCEMVEGEKDPRNLMLSFSIVRVVLLEFEIADNVDDLFDITFCYFPITFTPPPDDPYGITSDDLVVALRHCLCATPRFGKLALPLFLDKMQAASEKAKRQTLQALTVCFPVYGAAVSGEWAGRFSEALSIEVFHATDDDTAELALTTFKSLFSTLYPDNSPVAVKEHGAEDEEMAAPEAVSGVEGVGVKVVANSLEELREPDKSNAKPATRILAALITSSNRVAHYVLSRALPQLIAFYKDPDEVSLRAPVLTSISTLLAALAPTTTETPSSATSSTLSHTDGASPLEPFRDDLLSTFTSGSRSPASRSAALDGLVNLVRVTGFLSPPEVSYCVSAINDVLGAPDSEDQYDEALDGLVTISELHPRIIEAETLPILFKALPDEAPLPGSLRSESYRRALGALAALCVHPDLFEILSLRLVARLDGVVSAPTQDKEKKEHASLYAHHLLATLRAVLKFKVGKGHGDVGKYIEKMVPKLLGMFVLPTLKSMDEGEVARDPRLLVDAGRVVTVVVQRCDVDRQSQLSDAMNAAFHGGNLVLLLGEQAKVAGEVPFQPLSSASSTAQQDTIALFSATLLAMRPTVSVTTEDLTTFLRDFLARLLQCENETQLVAGLHLIGSSVNKRAQDLADFLTNDLPTFWDSNVADVTKPEATRKAALRVWSWIAKGLVVRSDQRGYDMVVKILELFHDAALGHDAATALGVIAEEGDRVLSKENFAVIRLLYKQRFFTFLLPKLVSGHKESTGADQAVFLIALSCLLHHIPRQLTLTELPKLLPLLITSLDLPDPALRANVIETLGLLAKEVPGEMENSVTNIVPKVLRGVVGDEAKKGSVKLRLASLGFLGVLPAHIPYSVLHPQKASILRDLGKAVDDPRRDVRRAAVDTRSKWFLYGGSG
ncbi:ARM repeat-containing protein [Leucosporidium creatinivorum]|uniref:MMS19 nucleotide excision repair protein n=1 Tax=Leucosporidium creatinivorum TaxID=106004 RepID=A0A1Y2ERB8_9BASI|nr:ARM repeat-containing protein [Leucosporidium creatinivorum]